MSIINWKADPKYGPLTDDDRAAIAEIIRIWQTDPAYPLLADNIIAKYEKMLETGWGRKAGTFPAKEVSNTKRANEYTAYIASPEWKAKAERIKQERGNRCQLCGNDKLSLHAHHNNYDRLGHEDDADITVLCVRCHKEFHERIGMPT